MTPLPLIAVLLPASASTGADGGFFFARAGIGHSADQRAILFYDPYASRKTLVLATGQDWDDPQTRADYAWVVPVPTQMEQDDFTVLEDGLHLFAELDDLTEPRARIWRTPGCGCAGPASSGDAGQPLGVSELSAFAVEQYQIHILSATESRDLQGWLQENGYAFSADSVPILQHYVDRGWYFAAVRVSGRIVPVPPAGKRLAGLLALGLPFLLGGALTRRGQPWLRAYLIAVLCLHLSP